MQEIIIALFTALSFFLSPNVVSNTNLEEIFLNALGTEVLGINFLLIGTAATFLMFYQWGLPYDKDLHRSEAHPG